MVGWKGFRGWGVLALCCAVLWGCVAEAAPLSALKEGWGWPVVVLPPEGGWNSPAGQSVKWALRTAEREVSLTHQGVHGRDVVFLYAPVDTKEEALKRLPQWRAMGAGAILCFASGDLEAGLIQACAYQGPSLILAGGEERRIRDPKGKPCPYLFALDLYRNYRANAFAALAGSQGKELMGILSDPYAVDLARTARLSARFLEKRGVPSRSFWMSGQGDDEMGVRLAEMESSGARRVICWLGGMGTRSLWKTAAYYRKSLKVWHGGPYDPLLQGAEGVLYLEQDAPLQERLKAQDALRWNVLRKTRVRVTDLVLAGKAYALGHWAIGAFLEAGTNAPAPVAAALARNRDVPLLGETLSINPGTHRPHQREVGVMRIRKNQLPLRETSLKVTSQGVVE